MDSMNVMGAAGMDPMQDPVNKAMRQAVEQTVETESNLVRAAVNPAGDAEAAVAENAPGQIINLFA